MRDADLAHDVTQVVFFVLAQKATTIRPGTVLSAWLLKATRFTANSMSQTALILRFNVPCGQILRPRGWSGPVRPPPPTQPAALAAPASGRSACRARRRTPAGQS